MTIRRMIVCGTACFLAACQKRWEQPRAWWVGHKAPLRRMSIATVCNYKRAGGGGAELALEKDVAEARCGTEVREEMRTLLGAGIREGKLIRFDKRIDQVPPALRHGGCVERTEIVFQLVPNLYYR